MQRRIREGFAAFRTASCTESQTEDLSRPSTGRRTRSAPCVGQSRRAWRFGLRGTGPRRSRASRGRGAGPARPGTARTTARRLRGGVRPFAGARSVAASTLLDVIDDGPRFARGACRSLAVRLQKRRRKTLRKSALHDIRERIEPELLENVPDPLNDGDRDAGAKSASYPRPCHGALEPLDDFEHAFNASESVTEGDEIERGRLRTADGKRRREPRNFGEGRALELRLHVEIEMDFPDSDGPARPAKEYLRDLDGLG